MPTTAEADVKRPMDVPLVADAHLFVCVDAARLKAMEDAGNASSPEAKLEAVTVVATLYKLQIDAVDREVMPELGKVNRSDPRRTAAGDWLDAWLAESKPSFEWWTDFKFDV